jgi:hypothetical protein
MFLRKVAPSEKIHDPQAYLIVGQGAHDDRQVTQRDPVAVLWELEVTMAVPPDD